MAQPVPVKLRFLSGYNLSPKIPLQSGANFFVITKQKVFDKTFGIDKGTPPLPNPPDFKKEMVIVMAAMPTERITKMMFTNATRAGNYVEVYCNYKKTITPLTYTEFPIVVATLPIIPEVNEIRFYQGKDELAILKTK
ncbi:hypothetical protein DN068_18905 [Taibaiella soli]|uniref:Uncharacterized protein n=2 Tax=Taibaiella soli TaxID=1649169 RepID=A0A2W2ATT0_9BACT|nr:hypothetical protein DN068_18905 [Taibaiella soli]